MTTTTTGGGPPTAGDGHQPQFPKTRGTTTTVNQLFTPHGGHLKIAYNRTKPGQKTQNRSHNSSHVAA